ncbi:hypothetical protein DFS34DRAFT_694507 [Phlyctochytrium arcticum]|nr:hypothetical protein DFS34DRAFT_694507 [Phlyctochytrium arcticum]
MEFAKICKFLVASNRGTANADPYYQRAVFLCLHMFMSRYEDIVRAKLSDLMVQNVSAALNVWIQVFTIVFIHLHLYFVIGLRNLVFPQLEASKEIAKAAQDKQPECFVEFMENLAIVLLQDAVEMKQIYPEMSIWRHALFGTELWQEWETRLGTIMAETATPTNIVVCLELLSVLPKAY